MKAVLSLVLLTACSGEPFHGDIYASTNPDDAGTDTTAHKDAAYDTIREDSVSTDVWVADTASADGSLDSQPDSGVSGDVTSPCQAGVSYHTCGGCDVGYSAIETCTGNNCPGGCGTKPYSTCVCTQ